MHGVLGEEGSVEDTVHCNLRINRHFDQNLCTSYRVHKIISIGSDLGAALSIVFI